MFGTSPERLESLQRELEGVGVNLAGVDVKTLANSQYTAVLFTGKDFTSPCLSCHNFNSEEAGEEAFLCQGPCGEYSPDEETLGPMKS